MKRHVGLFGCLIFCAVLTAGIGCSGKGSKSGNTPASSSSKEMISFEIISPVSVMGVIDETTKIINVTVPYKTDVTKLIVKFETTGIKTTVNSIEQLSSLTVNNFTSSLAYMVSAQDDSVSVYTVKVTIAPANQVNALSSLVLSYVILSPTFDPATTSYTASVDYSVSSITVTPTVTDATVIITVNNVTIASGTASGVINLSVGANAIIVNVTSQSGEVRTYNVSIVRSIETTIGNSTIISFPVTGSTFKLISTPTVSAVTAGVTPLFPTTTTDTTFVNIPTSFTMSETDVTYQLWKEVYDWATNSARGTNKYKFANVGQNGTDGTNSNNGFNVATTTQYPVTKVNWRDAIIWCNALTEYYNANNGIGTDLAIVYCSDSGYDTPIRESTNSTTITYTNNGSQDAPYVNPSAKGFRLPTSMEYEFAARYIGTTAPASSNIVLKDGVYYTNGTSASGATATCTDNVITSLFSVFFRNYTAVSTFTSVSGTATVKSKAQNALGLYDMSGNMWKWCFDWYPGSTGLYRVVRGGAFGNTASYMQVGYVSSGYSSPVVDPWVSFRISRSK